MCCFFLSFIFTYFSLFFCSYIQKQNTRPYFIFFFLRIVVIWCSPTFKKKQCKNYHHPSYNDDLTEKKRTHANLFVFFFALFSSCTYIYEYFSSGFYLSWAFCLYLSVHRFLLLLLSKTTKQWYACMRACLTLFLSRFYVHLCVWWWARVPL